MSSASHGPTVVPGDSVHRVHFIDPPRARQILERLGPTFVKLGQFLALRPDLVAQEYCDEFLKLTDQVTSFPFPIVRQTIESDLGGSLESRFSFFNPRPLSAASLAQVHVACTQDRATVAVKVQRPDIRQSVDRDLRRARLLSLILEVTGSSAVISPHEIVNELSRWMHDELDMKRELRNLARMHRLSQGHRNMQVPLPYPELSGAHILTAEYLPGVPLTELLRYVRANRADRIEALGFDRKVLAANVLDSVLTQIFRYEFFQADTHPGNLLAMPDNAVGFVDFGLTEELDPSFRQGMIRYLAAVYSGDLESMFGGLLELLIPGSSSNPRDFRRDFYEQDRRWRTERSSKVRGSAGEDSPTSRYLVGVLRAARRNHYTVPQGILSLYRALLTAETLASQLGGEVDLPEVASRIFQGLQIDTVVNGLRPEQLQPLAVEVLQLARDGPRQLRQMLNDLADGRFVLSVRTEESTDDRRRTNTRARMVAAAVLAVGLSVLVLAGRGILLPWGIHLSSVLWTMLVVDWILVVILWRRLS